MPYIQHLSGLNQKVPRPAQDAETATLYSRIRIETHWLSLRRTYWQLMAPKGGRVTLFRAHVSWQVAFAPVDGPISICIWAALTGLGIINNNKKEDMDLWARQGGDH